MRVRVMERVRVRMRSEDVRAKGEGRSSIGVLTMRTVYGPYPLANLLTC